MPKKVGIKIHNRKSWVCTTCEDRESRAYLYVVQHGRHGDVKVGLIGWFFLVLQFYVEIELGHLTHAQLADGLAFGPSRAVRLDFLVSLGLNAQVALTDFVETARGMDW